MSVSEVETAAGVGVSVASFTMLAGEFRAMLVGASVARSSDKSSPTLAGVLLEWDNGPVTVASTDRYRLVVGESKGTTGNGKARALLPKDATDALVKAIPSKAPSRYATPDTVPHVVVLVADRSLTVTMYPHKDAASAEWSRVVQLLDGEFPKFRSLLPTEFGPVESFTCNPVFMADAAKLPTDRKGVPVRWRFTREDRPAVADFPSDEGPVSWLYLLMPVRLNR